MIGLDLAIAFARGRWMALCDKACRENRFRNEGISEKTMREVEEAERQHNELIETKRERA